MPIDARWLLLVLPTGVVLVLLVAHSLVALPRRRALVFWIAAIGYGIVRGVAVRLVTEHGLGAPFPYVVHRALLQIGGVSLQEVAGWAIVSYLGFWLGNRLARAEDRAGAPRLYPQVLVAATFLGCIGFTIESTALSASWWHWTIPASGGILGPVPWTGIVDWSFVAFDFLLPFLVLTARSDRPRSRFRLLSLLLFPLHFGAHAVPQDPTDPWRIPAQQLVHLVVFAGVFGLAARSALRDEGFSTRARLLPILGLASILLDLLVVGLLVAPVGSVARVATPILAGACALVLVPAGVALALRFCSRGRAWRPVAAVALLVAAGGGVHVQTARASRALVTGLEEALALRDHGQLDAAVRVLEKLRAEHPREHAPHVFLGEVQYRRGRLAEARAAFAEAVALKGDFVRGYRFLAVIDLRRGDLASARAEIARGLAIEPRDPELGYL